MIGARVLESVALVLYKKGCIKRKESEKLVRS